MNLTLFLAITFALTWAIYFTVDPMGGLNPIFLIGVFAPSIVAIALTWRSSGRPGVQELLSGITRWDVGARWYIFAISYMALVRLVAIIMVRLVDGAWPTSGDNLLLLPFAIAISTPVQAGEEIGWRAYALPRLTKRYGLRVASVVLGAIWALWHLPLFYVPGTDTTGQSFPIFTAQVTAISVAMAWLYSRTKGSLLLVMLMHSAINQLSVVTRVPAPVSEHPWTLNTTLTSWFTLVLLWIGATYFLIRMPRKGQNPGF